MNGRTQSSKRNEPCNGFSTVNHPKYETTAHLLGFGVSQSRKSRREREAQGIGTRVATNANNTKYAELYACLCTYLDALPPGIFGPTATYHAAIVSKNSNIGHAALTALGHHEEGGKLLVADNLRRTSYASSL